MTKTADEIVPSGCSWCGVEKRIHMSRWTMSAGWHQWQPPDIDQIKTRMRLRRALRNTAGAGQ